MTWPLLRGPLGLSCRRCLTVVAPPTLVAALAAGLLHWLLPPQLGDDRAPAAASPWLALPMVVAAMGCAVVAAVFWPTFARARPGRDWVDRAQRGWTGGIGGAIAGALLAQFVLTLPLTTVLAALLGAPGAAHSHVALRASTLPVLDAQRPRLTFPVPTGEAVGEVWLRPLVGLPSGAWQGTTVDVFADGERLPALGGAFVDNRQLARVRFPGRTIRELTVVHTAGTLPLLFEEQSIGVVGDADHSNLANGALLALLALLPTFVALALAGCCGLAAGLATVLAVVASALFLQTLGGLGAFDAALLALLRGQWLAASAHFPRTAPSLALGCTAMIATMVLRPKVCR